jgi:hypothetical protein
MSHSSQEENSNLISWSLAKICCLFDVRRRKWSDNLSVMSQVSHEEVICQLDISPPITPCDVTDESSRNLIAAKQQFPPAGPEKQL